MYRTSKELGMKWLGIGVDGDTVIYCGEDLSSENIYGAMAGIFLAVAEGVKGKEYAEVKGRQFLEQAAYSWLKLLDKYGGQDVEVMSEEGYKMVEDSELLNQDGKPFEKFIIAAPHRTGVAVRVNFDRGALIKIIRSTLNLMKDIEGGRHFPNFLCVYNNLTQKRIEQETETAKYDVGGEILDFGDKPDVNKGN